MAQQLGQWELRGTGQWALEEKASGAFVGRAGMHFPGASRLARYRDRLVVASRPLGQGLHDRSGRGRDRLHVRASRRRRALQRDPARRTPRRRPSRNDSVSRCTDTRALSHFPSMAHGIWRLQLDDYHAKKLKRARRAIRRRFVGTRCSPVSVFTVTPSALASTTVASQPGIRSAPAMSTSASSDISSRSLTRRDRDRPDLGVGEGDRWDPTARRDANPGSGCRAGTWPGRRAAATSFSSTSAEIACSQRPPRRAPSPTRGRSRRRGGARPGGGGARWWSPGPRPLVVRPQAAVAVELDEALVDEAADGLRDRRGREPEPLHEPGPHRHDALLFEREDRLEVLLGRVVQLGHGRTLRGSRARLVRAEFFGLHSRGSSANMG